MRKEMEPCAQCEKHLKHIRYLDDQLGKFNVKLGTFSKTLDHLFTIEESPNAKAK